MIVYTFTERDVWPYNFPRQTKKNRRSYVISFELFFIDREYLAHNTVQLKVYNWHNELHFSIEWKDALIEQCWSGSRFVQENKKMHGRSKNTET